MLPDEAVVSSVWKNIRIKLVQVNRTAYICSIWYKRGENITVCLHASLFSTKKGKILTTRIFTLKRGFGLADKRCGVCVVFLLLETV